ncbi:MAG: hypothetical protein RMK30_10355 [Anaerolineae bacterium]|nr:hypothetical protein [Anaerolineae bacterium]
MFKLGKNPFRLFGVLGKKLLCLVQLLGVQQAKVMMSRKCRDKFISPPVQRPLGFPGEFKLNFWQEEAEALPRLNNCSSAKRALFLTITWGCSGRLPG